MARLEIMPEKQLENIQCVPSAEMQESLIREESLTFALPTFWFKVSKDVKSCNSGDQKKHSMYNVNCNKDSCKVVCEKPRFLLDKTTEP